MSLKLLYFQRFVLYHFLSKLYFLCISVSLRKDKAQCNWSQELSRSQFCYKYCLIPALPKSPARYQTYAICFSCVSVNASFLPFILILICTYELIYKSRYGISLPNATSPATSECFHLETFWSVSLSTTSIFNS